MADICCGPTATGTGTGEDWNNQFAFNSGTLVRGNRYFLRDDAGYTKGTYNIANSSTTRIGIIKATEAAHVTDTGWSSTMGDGVALFDSVSFNISTSYWDFDGVVGGGPGTSVSQWPDVWRTGHGIKILGGGGGGEVVTLTGSNVTFKHLELEHEDGDIPSEGAAIFKSTVGPPADDITIEYCYFWHQKIQAIWTIGCSNWLVQYNFIGPNGTGDPLIHRAAYAGLGDTNMTFRWNIWFNMTNTAIVAHVNGGTNTNILFYGNICIGPEVNTSLVDSAHPDGDAIGFRVINNTIWNWEGSWKIAYGSNFSDCLAANNLFIVSEGNAFFSGTVNSHSYWDCKVDGVDTDTTFAAIGSNGVALSANPLTDAAGWDFTLNTALPGIDAGSPFDVDMFGNTRSTWNRGALEADGGGPPPPEDITINATNLVVGTLTIG